MDKLKLYSPQKDIISPSILDNDFVNTRNYSNPIKHYYKASFKNNNLIIDITSCGTNILVNPTIYLKGNNIVQISKDEMVDFIEKFEDELKIDSNSLRLTGFDFNQNIYTNFPPKAYLNLFRFLPKYGKKIHKSKSGITFENDCKSLVIYDKKKEMDKKKIITPAIYQDKNILRIELCVNEKMKQTNNLKFINTMKDITTPDNYNKIVNEWQGTFAKINKQQTFIKMGDLISSPKMDIQDEAILNYINEITMEGYFNNIDSRIELGCLTPKQARTRKEKALAIWSEFISQPENSKFDLLSEINEKVNQTANKLIEGGGGDLPPFN